MGASRGGAGFGLGLGGVEGDGPADGVGAGVEEVEDVAAFDVVDFGDGGLYAFEYAGDYLHFGAYGEGFGAECGGVEAAHGDAELVEVGVGNDGEAVAGTAGGGIDPRNVGYACSEREDIGLAATEEDHVFYHRGLAEDDAFVELARNFAEGIEEFGTLGGRKGVEARTELVERAPRADAHGIPAHRVADEGLSYRIGKPGAAFGRHRCGLGNSDKGQCRRRRRKKRHDLGCGDAAAKSCQGPERSNRAGNVRRLGQRAVEAQGREKVRHGLAQLHGSEHGLPEIEDVFAARRYVTHGDALQLGRQFREAILCEESDIIRRHAAIQEREKQYVARQSILTTTWSDRTEKAVGAVEGQEVYRIGIPGNGECLKALLYVAEGSGWFSESCGNCLTIHTGDAIEIKRGGFKCETARNHGNKPIGNQT